jgi:hypothetical protein
MQVFASLPNILAPRPDVALGVSGVSELCFKLYINVFGRDALLAEKPNDDSVVGLRPLNENRKRTDPEPIMINVLLM